MKTVEEFMEKGYIVVKNAINTDLRDFITQYVLFDEIQDFNSEESQVLNAQVPKAHAKYGDPAMETMLLQLHPLMEESTGLDLHPTYSFYRVYRNGHQLPPHTDRPSCEISATMCFNYSYQNYDWPIFMDGHPLVLKPGELAIYRGIDLEHWREPLDVGKNSWHVQGFFHYVEKYGQYSNYKYDKRESIGIKKIKNKKKYIFFTSSQQVNHASI